jgi:hypothetical protein
MCPAAEVAFIDMFYKSARPGALVATLSLCNPETGSPFMWWLFNNEPDIRRALENVAPLSLGYRLLDRAMAEGPAITGAYQTLHDAAAREIRAD